MDKKVLKFLTKANIKPSDILYFIREERQTVVHLVNGETVSTYIPMKYLLAAMPKGAFLNITKGVVIAAGEIARIDGAVYTMRSGQQFLGRRRGAGEHKTNRTRLENRADAPGRVVADSLQLRFSGLDNSPLACCVIELVINGAGVGEDFVLRYCNEAFLKQEGFSYGDAIDRSFFELFPEAERKWLSMYNDVAIHGEEHVMRHTDAKTGDRITVYCYRPMSGYCAAIKTVEKDSKLSYRRIDE